MKNLDTESAHEILYRISTQLDALHDRWDTCGTVDKIPYEDLSSAQNDDLLSFSELVKSAQTVVIEAMKYAKQFQSHSESSVKVP